jgi:hypothetical protein
MARLQLLQVANLWRHVESLSFGAGVKTLRSPCSSLPSSWSSSMQNPFQCLGVSFSTLQQQQQQRVMMMTTMTFASHNHPNFLPLALASRGLRPQEQLLVGCLPVINYGQSNSWLTSQGLKFFFSTTTTLPADASSRQEEGGVVEVEKEKSSSTGGGAEINTAAAHNKKGMMDGAPKYSVVRINSDGSWLSLSLTSAQLVSACHCHFQNLMMLQGIVVSSPPLVKLQLFTILLQVEFPSCLSVRMYLCLGTLYACRAYIHEILMYWQVGNLSFHKEPPLLSAITR